eukprot:Em0018g267a
MPKFNGNVRSVTLTDLASYYNSIASLKELFRLRHNPNLKSFAPRPTALEDDTDRLLDLISKAEAIKPTRSEGTGRHGDIQWDNVAGTSSPVFPPSPRQHSDEPPQGHAQTQDPNLEFTDELEAYRTFPGVKANFTPAPISITTTKPESGPSQTTPLTTPFTKQPLQDVVSQLLELFEQYSRKGTSVRTDSTLQGKLMQCLQQLMPEGPSSAAGPSSSPSHQWHDSSEDLRRQLSLKEAELVEKEKEMADLQHQLEETREEKEAMERQAREVDQAWQSSGSDTKKQVAALRQEVQVLRDENTALKATVDQTTPTDASEMASLHEQLFQTKEENRSLKAELQSVMTLHDQEVQHYIQVQELAAMLQESHRALVATNDRLLQDLEEARERHKMEKEQMGRNYEHLRNNVEMLRSSQVLY